MTDIFSLFQKIGSSTPAAKGPVTHLVVGLGNPGKDYEGTRHNAGFICIDEVARRCGVKILSSKFHALVSEAECGGKRVLLMKPQTFMNLSGAAVAEAAGFYQIPPERILVICDDINFGVGHARIRLKGSNGGHNGLRNIEDRLGSQAYMRIRVGVGQKPSPEYDLAAWVLGRFPQDELRLLEETMAPRVADAVELMLAGKPEDAMSRYSK